MDITEVHAILKQLELRATRIKGTRYGIVQLGDVLFSLDISKVRDEAHLRERIQQEMDYLNGATECNIRIGETCANKTAQETLGHATLAVTGRYAHARPEDSSSM